MEPIRPIALSPPSAAVEVPSRPVASAPVVDTIERAPLDPAVKLALSPATVERQKEPDQRGYVRDADSQAVVFRVTDPASGDVIIQIPDEIVLKARVYARQDAAPSGERVETTA